VTGVKSSRRRSREFALQGVYQWLIGRRAPADIAQDIELFRGFDKCDAAYFRELLDGAIQENAQTEAQLQSCVDRPLTQLSPIEHAILLIAACEFTQHPDVPYRVVINEAVELAKAFGAPTDPVDVFAYVAALLASPAYTSKFKSDLIRPGLRVPLTANAALFAEAAALGREVALCLEWDSDCAGLAVIGELPRSAAMNCACVSSIAPT